MNASLQALRTIPELQTTLSTYSPRSTSTDVMFTKDLKNLFNQMNGTTQAVGPFRFLASLRTVNPQFAEQAQGHGGMGGGYAQQGEHYFSLPFPSRI